MAVPTPDDPTIRPIRRAAAPTLGSRSRLGRPFRRRPAASSTTPSSPARSRRRRSRSRPPAPVRARVTVRHGTPTRHDPGRHGLPRRGRPLEGPRGAEAAPAASCSARSPSGSGLVNEDQVLKALGEQLGMKVVKLADTTIPAEADRAGQRDDGHGVQGRAVSHRARRTRASRWRWPSRRTRRRSTACGSFLGVEVKGVIAAETRRRWRRSSGSTPASRSRSRTSSSRSRRTRGSRQFAEPQREHDRPRGHRGDGRGRAGPQADQHGAAAGDQGQGLGHPLRAVRGRVQDALPRSTACSTRWCRRRGTWPPPSPAASRSWRTSTSPSAGCRRTAASS